MRSKKHILVIIFLALIHNIWAQSEPKREMRSTWIASVGNIDWPKYEDRGNPDAQKAELIRMFDLYQSINLNAVFLQVRSECDALYNSAYEPWSRYLTWAQGDDPGYDPLAFALQETHKRGLELHVWMNPYRINASTSDGGDYYDDTHIYIEHPEWAIEYSNGKKILNPGRPEVMSYIGAVVRDLVSNYMVDGVHFDDYFYSYDGTPESLDATEYASYGAGMSLDDWRRDNVNRMIDTVYQVIQDVNPNVRFGVSPFGIYKNGVPAGIVGLDAYSVIYCDPLAWLENESVDYLTPQLYWPTGGSQDFEALANWWSNQVFNNNRHLYTGHGIYRLDSNPNKSKSPKNPNLHENKRYFDNLSMAEKQDMAKSANDWTLSEIGLQIDIVRLNHDKNGLGGVYFSADDFDRVNGLADYINQNKYTHPAIIPEMTWKNSVAPAAPQNLRLGTYAGEQILTWDHTGGSNVRFAVYISSSLATADEIIADGNNINLITFNDTVKYTDLGFSQGASFVVTAISAIGKESEPSPVLNPEVDFPVVTLSFPQDGAMIGNTDSLVWTVDKENTTFTLQIASNANFSNIVFETDGLTDTIFNISQAQLDGEQTLFWRVRAKTQNQGPFSDARSFDTGYPVMPELLTPANLDQNVATQLMVKWQSSFVTDSVQVLVSEISSFNTLAANELFPADDGNGTLTTELENDTWYYLKIRSVNEYGYSNYTAFVSFKTTAGTIPDVVYESPVDGATVASFDQLKWNSTVTQGTINYKVEVALDETFDVVVFQSDWMSEKEINIGDLYLDGQKNYYWHVKASSEFGESEFTPGRSFFAGYPSRPSITAPQNLSSNVSTRPHLAWNCDASADSVYFEFAEQSDFDPLFMSETFAADNTEAQLSNHLDAHNYYYMQMQAKNEYGSSIFSAIKSFSTGAMAVYYPKVDQQVTLYPSIISTTDLRLTFRFKKTTTVTVDLYNLLGEKLENLYSDQIQAGSDVITIENQKFAKKGMFIVKITMDDFIVAKKIQVQ